MFLKWKGKEISNKMAIAKRNNKIARQIIELDQIIIVFLVWDKNPFLLVNNKRKIEDIQTF